MAISEKELSSLDRWFRAANYLTVAQIYLRDNVLLREALTPEQIKPRLLGHWGTSPGINLVWAHLNRWIQRTGTPAMLLVGPGHGGPAANANAWLEGSWSERYPDMPRDMRGMRALCRAFSTPGGVPSHMSSPTPGSMHEGGELGYVLSHAAGAASDNPELVVAAMVGDGEAETGPLEGSWKIVDFLDPARDGAVLPILHLNGYKIANPTVLGRKSDNELAALFEGHGWAPELVAETEPARMHIALAAAMERIHQRICDLRAQARRPGARAVLERWPMLILRSPKGWTGPKEVDGVPVEGTFRAHQVPLGGVRENPQHLAQLEQWMRSYRPEELFDQSGAPRPEVLELCPRGPARLSATPHANGGELLRPLALPSIADHSLAVAQPGREKKESTRQLGQYLRDVMKRNGHSFRVFSPDELTSNRLGDLLDATSRSWMEPRLPGDDRLSPDGRVLEVLSEHLCEGWLEGYVLTGRHGLFATYEAFAMIVASMATQHAKWLQMARELTWREPVASLNVLLTSTCWRNDHNGFSHQGPGFIDTLASKQGAVARIYLPPDANCLLSVAEHCLRSRSYVNAIVIDKQPQLQWLPLEAARAHCAAGASRWAFASSDDERGEPDVVLACAGDIPTLETLAAAHWLRERAPALRVRVINVVDLFRIASPAEHPHGMPDEEFARLFTRERDVVFAFHGYPNLVHGIIHGRPHASRFHVRGYREEGTTTTPFQMVALNGMSRFDLAAEALRRARRIPIDADALIAECERSLEQEREHAYSHFEDRPEIANWSWT